MARPKELINAKLTAQAKADLQRIKDHKICQRLQAIISSEHHSITTVASINGVGRDTIWRWIKNYRQAGLAGLQDKPKGHRHSKLTEKQWQEVEKWLTESCDSKGEAVHWTLPKLRDQIKRDFGIRISRTSLWYHVHKMGFRQKTPRPVHAKADRQAQEAFKKNPKKSR